MKNLFIAFISISIAATSSCSLIKNGKLDTVKAEKATEQKPKRERPAIRKAAVGDKVVARWAPERWAEGRVDAINEGRSEAKVIWNDDSSPSDVDIADVFLQPKAGDPVTVEPGDYTLVKSGTGEWWSAAQVKEVIGNVVKAKLINGGDIVNVPSEKVLAVSEAVGVDIKDQADREDFTNKAHERRPATPSGYVPKVGDHILGEWTTYAWFGGTIKAVKDDRVTVIWENGMKPDDAAYDKFVPYPNAANSTTPSVGDFVLVKPTNGNPKASWIYAQVTAVNGTGIEAKDIDYTREYKAGDYVVLTK